tara:strand:- start:832 stop:1575 length:744 start_codon:yes stop_codon:yes gene_type:complete
MLSTNIFQILISDDDSDKISNSILDLSKELCRSFPNSNYSIWNDKQIIDFLESNYEPQVCKAYESLVPYAYRSDLARYCLLNHFGGWYFDIGTQLANSSEVAIDPQTEMLFFWDIGDLFSPGRSFYDCMNGLIYSKPSNPILLTAIDLIVNNCRSKFYGTDSMSPTGPGILGRAVAINGKTENHYDGQFIQLTPQHGQKNKAYVLRDGTIFAWHRSHFHNDLNGLNKFGLKGTNDYRKLWQDRNIYL